MPRTSSAALEVAHLRVDGRPAKLSPPANLNPGARKRFVSIVGHSDPRHFVSTDTEVLARYCSAHALAAEAEDHINTEGAVDAAGKLNPWCVVLEKMNRTVTALSMRLRLSPQARSSNDPKTVARRSGGYHGPPPWIAGRLRRRSCEGHHGLLATERSTGLDVLPDPRW